MTGKSLFTPVRRIVAYNSAYNRTYNELARLSGRELNDMGLGFGDIAQIAQADGKLAAARVL